MNNLSLISGHEPTMSSREIAELCDKRHDHVLADIRKMLAELALATPDFSGVYLADNGQQYECFHLPRRECDILVAGYSIRYRAAIVDRWRELERHIAEGPKLPTTFAEALRLAAEQAERLEQQQALLEQQRPAVEFAHRIAGADKGVTLGNFAKAAGLGPRKIFEILRAMRILMTGGERHNLPYQEYIERGYFTVRQSTYEANAEIRISHTPLITGKGERWLTGRLLDAGLLTARAVGE